MEPLTLACVPRWWRAWPRSSLALKWSGSASLGPFEALPMAGAPRLRRKADTRGLAQAGSQLPRCENPFVAAEYSDASEPRPGPSPDDPKFVSAGGCRAPPFPFNDGSVRWSTTARHGVGEAPRSRLASGVTTKNRYGTSLACWASGGAMCDCPPRLARGPRAAPGGRGHPARQREGADGHPRSGAR